jgi:glutaminyl-peptide cyclotransferase
MRRWSLAIAVMSAVVLVVGLLAVVLGAEDVEPGAAPTTAATEDCSPTPPAELSVEVVRTLPHDAGAYTQGLVVLDGRLFESTGREGASTLRELDPDTGDVLDQVPLAPDEFGEGLTVTDDGRLVQLTWTEGVAYEWDPDSLERLGEFRYEGEGWGLSTLEDGSLVMTDGSAELTLRDPDDFSVREARAVQRVGGDADRLNELEWDGESLWANRYQTDELLRIDPDCATVTGVADLSALREDATAAAVEAGTPIDVTNGIAHLPGTDRYLVTGKWWPTMYEVRIS